MNIQPLMALFNGSKTWKLCGNTYWLFARYLSTSHHMVFSWSWTLWATVSHSRMMPSRSLPWCVLNLGMQCFKCYIVIICTRCFSTWLEVQKQKSLNVQEHTEHYFTDTCMWFDMCVRMSAYGHVCVWVCVSRHGSIWTYKKSQLKVTNQTNARTFSSPHDLKKSYNRAAGPWIMVCHPKYNTWMLM